jgi:hypothetical protein
MIERFFEEVFRVGRTIALALRPVVILAVMIGLASVGCGSSNQDHTHSGEEIDSGSVGEARLDDSIARDNEVPKVPEVPFVRAHSGTFGRIPSGTTVTTNRVVIMAPVHGFVTITSTLEAAPEELPFERVCFSVWLQIGSQEIGAGSGNYCINPNDPNKFVNLALDVTVPVIQGTHQVYLMGGMGDEAVDGLDEAFG